MQLWASILVNCTFEADARELQDRLLTTPANPTLTDQQSPELHSLTRRNRMREMSVFGIVRSVDEVSTGSSMSPHDRPSQW